MIGQQNRSVYALTLDGGERGLSCQSMSIGELGLDLEPIDAPIENDANRVPGLVVQDLRGADVAHENTRTLLVSNGPLCEIVSVAVARTVTPSVS